MNEYIERLVHELTNGYLLLTPEKHEANIRTALTSAYNAGLERAKEKAKEIENELFMQVRLDSPAYMIALCETRKFIVEAIEKEKIESSPE